jgi:outer membrane protein OmpA-like peptidoglycan-associated protein
MSPKTVLVSSAAAFVMLCVATIAYYLPRLSPQTKELPSVPAAGAAQTATEDNRPEVEKMPAQAAVDHLSESGRIGFAVPESVPVKADSEAPASKSMLGPEAVELLDHPPIQFEISSSTLTQSSRVYLDEVAALLLKEQAIHLLIEGHTDSLDRLGKNQALSEARAKAVLDYLVTKGVPTDHLSSAGYGGSRPIADNATAEGRAKNRRIQFNIIS